MNKPAVCEAFTPAARYGDDVQPPFLIEVPHARYFVDDHCANCLNELDLDIAGLYCSTWCQEVAGHVRYMRRVFRDGRFDDPDIKLAIHTKNAFLLVGGYRSLGRRLTPRIRVEVRQRDSGICQRCGEPGVEVDHVAGNSDELDNLQLLCLHCHHAKTAQNFVPASEESRQLLAALVATRVSPDEPQLLADDEVGWNVQWRVLQKARKERFVDHLRNSGLRVRRNDSRATRVRAYLEATADVGLLTDAAPEVIGRGAP